MIRPGDEDALLDRFRRWLDDANAEAVAIGIAPSLESDPDDGIGLYRLAEEFTALRQEVKLQTKGSRGVQEQAETLLPALRQAIEHFRSVEPREAQAVWAAGKPLAEALADLDEAIERGRLEIERASRRLVDEADAKLVEALQKFHASQSWFRRRRTRAFHQEMLEVARRHGPATGKPFFDALLEGYDLIRSRLKRVMASEQIERIETVGRAVDPERMTVVDLVDGPARFPGEVVDEIRSGYLWRGRVLRYAEVRAARSSAPLLEESSDIDAESLDDEEEYTSGE